MVVFHGPSVVKPQLVVDYWTPVAKFAGHEFLPERVNDRDGTEADAISDAILCRRQYPTPSAPPKAPPPPSSAPRRPRQGGTKHKKNPRAGNVGQAGFGS
jgi:hypothetical protein